jgi:hypothetical protein
VTNGDGGRPGRTQRHLASHPFNPSTHRSTLPRCGNFIWDPFGLPKINFFCWVLMHRRVLTGENLAKRGIFGPHRCSLCSAAQETIDHLFIDYPYTQEVWTQAMHGLNAQTPSQLTVVNLIASWEGRSPHALKSKSTWAKIWYAIPKYICWEVWLARNEATFKNSLRTPIVVAAKAKALLLETLEKCLTSQTVCSSRKR